MATDIVLPLECACRLSGKKDAESALKALEMSRERAREMLARDKFTVAPIAPAVQEGKWFG